MVEVVSANDNLSDLKIKMEDYVSNGCKLGWLIDRYNKTVYIYHGDGSTETKVGKDTELSGEDLLVSLIVDLHF